jgi:hypothetical protein
MRATLSDRTITRCRLMVPAWGLPFAEVEIDGRDELGDSTVTLRISDLEATMTVLTSGSWRGRRRYRLVGGSGGWGETIPARGYTSDLRVLRATVAADAAAAAGEIIDVSGLSTDSLGGHWTRPEGPAARTLELLAPQGWRVGLDGITRFGAPPEVEYVGDATRVDLPDRAVGRIELAPQQGSVAALVPGAVVDGTVAVDVEHRIADGALRTSLWAAHGASSRLLSALGRIVEQLTARYRFAGSYSYRVVAQDGDRLDLQPERSAAAMPWLSRVRPRYFPGLRVDHQLGSLVVVQFLDSDPARPVVTGGDDPESEGWLPETVRIDADGDVEVAGGIYPVLLNGQTGLTLKGTVAGNPFELTLGQIYIGPVPPVPPPLGPARLLSGDVV